MERVKNRIYISGQVSGLPHQAAYDKFKTAEMLMRGYGFDVVNPLEISPLDDDKTWKEHMTERLDAIPACDALYLMPCWTNGKEPHVEIAVAERNHVEVFYMVLP